MAELTTPDGFTYDQLIGAGWTDEMLKGHPEYNIVVPKNETISVPIPPPSPPVSEKKHSDLIDDEFDPAGAFDMDLDKLNAQFDNTDEIEVEDSIDLTENYSPEDSQKVIGKVSPADFDNMIKILNLLKKEKNVDAITIKNSKIIQGTSSYIIEADMTKILKHNGQTISFDILDPKTYVDLFKEFRSSNDIFILDDSNNKRYILTNGEIRLQLPKKITEGGKTETSINNIDVSNSTPFCKRTIDKDIRSIIKNLSKNSSFIEYLIQDNQLKGMNIPDIAIYIFPEFVNDKNSKNLDETNSDLTLRTASFLPIDAESYNIELFKNNDKYISITKCQIGGQIDVVISEFCDDTTGGGLTLI